MIFTSGTAVNDCARALYTGGAHFCAVRCGRWRDGLCPFSVFQCRRRAGVDIEPGLRWLFLRQFTVYPPIFESHCAGWHQRRRRAVIDWNWMALTDAAELKTPAPYFPIQNRLNISPNKSSGVNSPLMLLNCCRAE